MTPEEPLRSGRFQWVNAVVGRRPLFVILGVVTIWICFGLLWSSFRGEAEPLLAVVARWGGQGFVFVLVFVVGCRMRSRPSEYKDPSRD